MVQPLWFLKELKPDLPHDLEIPFLVINSKKLKTGVSKRYLDTVFIETLLTIANT